MLPFPQMRERSLIRSLDTPPWICYLLRLIASSSVNKVTAFPLRPARPVLPATNDD